jgi:hypothetical protein
LGVAAIGAGLLWRYVGTWCSAVIGMAVVSFGLIPAYPASAWLSHRNGIAATQRVAEALKAIDSNTPIDKLPVFWIDDFNDANTVEYRSIMCALQTQGSSMWKYPAVDPTKKYAPGTEVILITQNKDAFESANASLSQAGMPLRMGKQQLIFGEGDVPLRPVSYWLTFTDVLAPPQDTEVPTGEILEVVPNALTLAGLLPDPTHGVTFDSGPPVRITTAPQQWAYAAYEELPFTSSDRNRTQLRMVVKVLSGNVAFGILDNSERIFHARASVGPGRAFQEVVLEIEHPQDSRRLVIQNETPGGQSAEAVVSKIDLLAYPSSNISRRLAPKDKAALGKAPKGH